ncbi:MAG: hypothetical protein ACRD9R_05200 [Pyrinomonadaceae bacterium]
MEKRGIPPHGDAAKQGPQPWPPSRYPEQARAVRQAFTASHAAVTLDELARLFTRARNVEELLQTLATPAKSGRRRAQNL